MNINTNHMPETVNSDVQYSELLKQMTAAIIQISTETSS